MWGFWDVCLLTAIDDSEIITSALQPEFNESYNTEGQSLSKVFSGICFEGIGTDINKISAISATPECQFIGIVNLKFASKWVLPNGQKITYKFLSHINNLLANCIFFPIHTFSTYEISIVILGNDLKKIFDDIFQIREMKVSSLFNNYELNRIKGYILTESESHLFVDSQSFYGARLMKESSESVCNKPKWGLVPNIEFKEIKAVFEVEAKPGHAKDLEKILDAIVKIEDERIMRFQTGLYDFYISWDFNSEAFKYIYNELRDVDSSLRTHIKKLKTKILFDYDPNNELFAKDEKQIIYKYFDLSRIEESLEQIKVSRSLRNQIIKLFSSFKNSFLNKVTYSTFIDLFYFVKSFEEQINEFNNEIQEFFDSKPSDQLKNSIMYIESHLSSVVETYKDSYYLRYLNERITDVQDFLIPHNTQLQAIIGFYDSYAKCVLSSLVDSKYGNSFILTFDDHFTSVNNISIKLLSTNLFEPGLIFTALSKELTTICSINVENCKHKVGIFESIKNLQIDINKFFIQNPENDYVLQKDYLVNFDYHYGVIDYLRYVYFFNCDLNLYLFYNLGFILQYPKVYDNTGNINEHQLFNEIQRLVVLNFIIRKKSRVEDVDNDNDCYHKLMELYVPPEIRSFWNDSLAIISNFVKEYDAYPDSEVSLFTTLETLIDERQHVLNFTSLIETIPDDSEFPSAKSFIDLSYSYMKKVYDKCGNIHSVSRDWKSGQVNIDFLKMKKNIKDPYFLFDSQGGILFINFDNLLEYTQIRNQLFEDLRHMATIYKSNIYNKIITDEKGNSV
jgi:hypothetical protein